MLLPFVAVFSLAAAMAAVAVPSHPHNPKAIKLHGAAGLVTVLYFTVEFNPDRLTDLKPGFDWHLGYAELNTEVDLMCGEVKVPKGTYKLNTRRGEAADVWTSVLVPSRLWKARGAVRQAARRGAEAETEAKAALEVVEAELKASGAAHEYELPFTEFAAAKAEHLEIVGIHSGYDTTARGSDAPAAGMQCSVRVSFGDLHHELKLTEVFVAKGK